MSVSLGTSILLTQRSRKVIQFKTDGSPSMRASILAVWGPKASENIVDLDLCFEVETDKSILRRVDPENDMCVSLPSHTAWGIGTGQLVVC